MTFPSGAARFLVAILATVTAVAACTIVYPSRTAGPSFQVRVNDRGRPANRLRVSLIGSNYSRSVETGENGEARFENIPPGSYHIGAGFDFGMSDTVAINVTASGPTDTTIPLRWPNHPVLPVQVVEGIFRWPAYLPRLRLATLQVELLDARTGRSLKATQTNGSGAFELGAPTPGLYFLRVAPVERALVDMQLPGYVPVGVGQAAGHGPLELDFSWTSCGVDYVASRACRLEELNVTSLSGQVLDPTGASIPRATVSLFQRDGSMAEQVTSNDEGLFRSPKVFEGEYEIVASVPGFTTLRQAVRATRPSDSARPGSLRVQLGIAGTCSHATVR